MSTKVLVIQFPGSNCEYETRRALRYYGLCADIVRWNEDPSVVTRADAYVLPGGFSYQDRVRAGAICAKLPILQHLQEANDLKKPILGICNGCQILAEAGLIEVTPKKGLQVALAPNLDQEKPIGFICDWVYVSFRNPQKNVFTKCYTTSDVLPVAINHGEGRFVFDADVRACVQDVAQVIYTDQTGAMTQQANPNGSEMNVAGVSNRAGNVLA